MTLLLLNANAVKIPLADESVHCVVTSPPYWGLRSYSGEQSQVWGGDPGCAHEWDIEIVPPAQKISDKTGLHNDGRKVPITEKYRETLNEYTPKDIERAFCLRCDAWYGELGLEPTPEQYIENMVAVFREVKRVLRADGTLWMNMGDSYATGGYSGDGNVTNKDPSRYPGGWRTQPRAQGAMKTAGVGGLKPKDLCGIPWRLAFALQADGWWLRSDIIWSKPNPMPESVTDRPTKAHEYVFLMSKSKQYFYDADAVRDEGEGFGKSERFRGSGYEHNRAFGSSNRTGQTGGGKSSFDGSGRNRRTVWHIATAPYSGAHFATYPPALVEPCIKAGTSERGVCPECGAPWERVVESTGVSRERNIKIKTDKAMAGINEVHSLNGKDYQHQRQATNKWIPTCEHDAEPIPAMVFDPFAGSGTTLQVARALGRHGVGLDLSAEYLQLARQRLELDRLDAWAEGVGIDDTTKDNRHKNKHVPGRQTHSFHAARKEKPIDDLPMFKEMG